jgi:CHAP domain./Cpl-7 lysozyme C-terminal domain./N-acetylmuramoyl-L-alanine amidase.
VKSNMALMTFDEYFKKYNGVGIDFDGQYSYQCFDLANDYAVKVLGAKPFIGMYAYEIYTNFNNQPSKDMYKRIANTPEFVPKKGDIIVWSKALNGTAGHVAICDGVGDTTYFYSYEENWDGMNHPTERVRHNYNYILGVLRPKDQTQITGKPTTPTTPATPTTTNGYSNSPLATKKNLFITNYNDRGGKKIDRITVHHMAGNLTVDGCKNALQSRGGSVNYAIQSDGTIGLLLPEKYRAWTSSSPENDYRAVTIEVANAPGAGEPDWKVTDAALQSTIKLCADICKRNDIKKLTFTGQLSGSNLTMHKWFYATGCPGPYMSGKFPYIVEQVNKLLGGGSVTPATSEYTVKITNKNGVPVYTTAGGGNSTTKANYNVVYTIVKDKTIDGKVWGKLKSGAGWIQLTGNTDKYPATKKSTAEVAKEVVAGKWGNGDDRKNRLTAAGYDYNAVQKEVDRLLKG